jgi:hypothetical protein
MYKYIGYNYSDAINYWLVFPEHNYYWLFLIIKENNYYYNKNKLQITK